MSDEEQEFIDQYINVMTLPNGVLPTIEEVHAALKNVPPLTAEMLDYLKEFD